MFCLLHSLVYLWLGDAYTSKVPNWIATVRQLDWMGHLIAPNAIWIEYVNNTPTMQFFSPNLICYHWLSVSGISIMVYCINMPYWRRTTPQHEHSQQRAGNALHHPLVLGWVGGESQWHLYEWYTIRTHHTFECWRNTCAVCSVCPGTWWTMVS